MKPENHDQINQLMKRRKELYGLWNNLKELDETLDAGYRNDPDIEIKDGYGNTIFIETEDGVFKKTFIVEYLKIISGKIKEIENQLKTL